jgi:hypothetical protein
MREQTRLLSFPSSGGLQKYFIVDLGVGENGQKLYHDHVVQQ